MSLLNLISAKSAEEFNDNRASAEETLREIFAEDFWGVDFDIDEYTEENFKSLWKNELGGRVRKQLASAGIDAAQYGTWLGKVHFSNIAVYPKRLFADYQSNKGWRIMVLSIPAVQVIAVGIASHYQGGQKHNSLGDASNLLFDVASEGLQTAGLVLPGRKVNAEDWDKHGLISEPITTVAGVEITDASPLGLSIGDVRTTTIKKIIASFICIEPVMPSEEAIRASLVGLETAARRLAGDIHPFCDLAEFEYFRALALEDLAAANMRYERRKRSTTRSVVRIYYGPPGTGKTLTAVQEAVKLADPAFEAPADFEKVFARFNELRGQVAFVTFHQSLQYEDVMESIRPFVVADAETDGRDEPEGDPAEVHSERLGYYIHQGPIMRIIRHAAENPQLEHVIVIDEINRGDISRIFGPLISALEPDKRAGAEFPVGFESQYPKAPALETRIFVPANLHVIGTMNSADRNIALVDHALRRRFDFVECPPFESLLPGPGEQRQIDLRLLLEALNSRLRYLVDRDHCIGHGYFMSCKTDVQIVECFARRIIPLLFEYFLGAEAQLLMVLGDRIGGPYNICKIAHRDQTFDTVFGTDLESALDLGYREPEIHLSLAINEQFWNPARLIPGPNDQAYAVNSLIKIYQPVLNDPA